MIIIVIHIAIIIVIIIYFFLHSSRAKLSGDIYNFAGDIVLDENITITTNITAYGQQHQLNDTGGNDNSSSKVVILTFGDTHKTQFSTAKPILDQYVFKASFFITCAYANDQKKTCHLSWNVI
jgi:hypothetical protein